MAQRAIFTIIEDGAEKEAMLPTSSMQVISMNRDKQAKIIVGGRVYISALNFQDTCTILLEEDSNFHSDR